MSELIGIAITRKIMGKMEEIESANVSTSSGIEGDARGKKRNRHKVATHKRKKRSRANRHKKKA